MAELAASDEPPLLGESRQIVDRHERFCSPRVTQNWEQFCNMVRERLLGVLAQETKDAVLPDVILAADGAVCDVSRDTRILAARIFNHNHHHKKDRKGTRSSAMQLWNDLHNGNLFTPEERESAQLFWSFYDDCDQDVCLYDWLIEHWREVIKDPALFDRFVSFLSFQDELDVHAGLVPVHVNDVARMGQLEMNNWVFEPYVIARRNGLQKLSGNDMLLVIDAVKERLSRAMHGKAERLPADMTTTVISNGEGWVMIDESQSGTHASMELATSNRIIIKAREEKIGEEQRWWYSVGQVDKEYLSHKKQPLRIDLMAFCAFLNVRDDKDPNSDDCWGGRNNVIGAPKKSRSKFAPLEMEELLYEFLRIPPDNRRRPPLVTRAGMCVASGDRKKVS